MSVNSDSDDKCRNFMLTHPQRRIWYTEKIYPGSSLHNIGGIAKIRGSINFESLEEAINIAIKKNDAIRLQITEKDGQAYQYVKAFSRNRVEFHDFSQVQDPEAELKEWVNSKFGKGIFENDMPLYHFSMFKLNNNESGYFGKLHHIIGDNLTINILEKQICDVYHKLENGEVIDQSVEFSYIDYIFKEQKYLESGRFLKNKQFWNEKFRDFPEEFAVPVNQCLQAGRKTLNIDKALSNRLREYAEKNKISLNTLFVAAFLVYLYKTTGHTDIVIGTPVLNRSGHNERNTAGMFISTMPFRMTINGSLSLMEFIKLVGAEIKKCYFNQKYPYDLLVSDLELSKKGLMGLFNVSINYSNAKIQKNRLNGLPMENRELFNGEELNSLQISIKDWTDDDCIILDYSYKVIDYTCEQVNRIHKLFTFLIQKALEYNDEILKEISLLSENDKDFFINKFNTTSSYYPREKVVYQLFEDQVERTPDRVAVKFDNCVCTYRKLNEKANQLARLLVYKGIKADSIVGLLTTHSLETIIGILGILKAGGAYLPIDPVYPAGRIDYMLEDSGAAVLLTNLDVDEEISFKGEIIDLTKPEIYSGDASNLGLLSTSENLVYIIYTSGSTGKPKGVMIEHRGLVNYIWWAKQAYVRHMDEEFPLYSSLAFDLTVTSVFTPIISGNRISIFSDDEDEFILYKIMRQSTASIIKLTPSHLALLKDIDNRNSSVKRLIVGGEDLKVSVARSIYESFGGDIEIFNEYGPTETVVGCMLYKYDPQKDLDVSVPIGIPANNVQIYVLDENLNPVPEGYLGEMYISGDCLARGYMNRMEMTAERFVSNPFIQGKRMYKTGDLARFTDCRILEYAGRKDYQVKVRGYRIELGEIERGIKEFEGVREAVVVCHSDSAGNSILCAYFVEKSEVCLKNLREHLLKSLPEYMVPLHFIKLQEIPLTNNGKVDIEKLFKPQLGNNAEENFKVAETIAEKMLVDVASQVLGVDRIGTEDSFHQLGGDSIKAIQIVSKLKQKGYNIKVRDMLLHPVIADMALYISEQEDVPVSSQEPCSGDIPFTPIISWFLSWELKDISYYNQSVLFSIKKNISTKILGEAFNLLIRHYDTLRANYNPQTRRLFYNNSLLADTVEIEEADLSGYPEDLQKEKVSSLGKKLKASFDIKNGCLIKACVFNLGKAGRKLLMTAHHLVVDGVSWRILLESMETMLEQADKKQQMILPPKTASYQRWAEELLIYSKNKVLEEQHFWKSAAFNTFSCPSDFETEQGTVRNCGVLTSKLSQEETRELVFNVHESYGTDITELLLASLTMAIKDFSGREEVIIEVEGHGREEILKDLDITRTVGWFTNIYPVIFKVENDLSSHIKSVKERLRKVPGKGIGYGVLKYLSKVLDSRNESHIRFNYLGDFDNSFSNQYLEISTLDTGSDYGEENPLTYIMEINSMITGGELNISLSYNKNRFKEERMQEFLKSFNQNITTVIVHCCEKKEVEFTPSDFDTLDLLQWEIDELFN